MYVQSNSKLLVIGTILASLLVQAGFSIGFFGPAWLSPVLSLPSLVLITWFWRRAEQQNQQNQAFNQLVV